MNPFSPLPQSKPFLIAAALWASMSTGCDMTRSLQIASSGQTGCEPDKIAVSDDEQGFGTRSWVAACDDKVFQCSGVGNTVSCKPIGEEQPAVQASTAPVVAPKQKAAPEWVTSQVGDCGIEAKFPATPKQQLGQVATKIGTVTTSEASFELADGAGVMQLTCSAAFEAKKPAAVVLDGARDGMLQSIHAKLVKESEIVGGREVRFELEGEQGVAHLLWVRNRVVMAFAAPISAFGERASKRFVNSVQVSQSE